MNMRGFGVRFGIGGRLVLGFGVLLGLSFLVGSIAVGSLLSIQASSQELSSQFLPEATLATEVERQTLKTMLGVRGYWLTTDKKYLTEAEQSLSALETALVGLQGLLDSSPALAKLRETLPKAVALKNTYQSLLAKTKAATVEILQIRSDMDASAKLFTTEITNYISSQETQLLSEIQAGARSAALAQRASKIAGAFQISNLGEELRVSNFKSQALRDTSVIKTAFGNFEVISKKISTLAALNSRLQDRQDLAAVVKAVDEYRDSIERWLSVNTTLDALAVSRTQTGGELSSEAESTSLAGISNSQRLAQTNSALVAGSVWSILLGLLVSIVGGSFVAAALIRGITKPLKVVATLSEKVTRGDFSIQRQPVSSSDELGQLMSAFYQMVDGLKKKAAAIETMANGNLTEIVLIASEEDELGRSLKRMQENLHEILTQVNSAVDQMASGSDQVSTAAQSLSQGATEQASSLEEISASANEIHSQSKQNAENAMTANQLAKQAAMSAQQGNQQMKDLLVLLESMTKSSEETKSIVKTIDDIAFQVNLLALNANVEAARAGKYGKGFAVVAEEVRNLAVRSASAVKETTRMVEESLRNIQDVNATALKTGNQLGGILGNANKVADFLEEIAASSQEQARSMGQINGGLEQIDQVTQSNTASAEQSASASEELSGQAQQLKVMISRFQLKGERSQGRPVAPRPAQKPTSPKAVVPFNTRPTWKPTETIHKPQQPNDIILNDDFDTF